ncbi:hypothetical protein JCM10296v2_003160 [Rhodotorula toruloides]
MASTDSYDPYSTPPPTLKPASPASRYTGPHRCVYSNDWKELYEAIAGEMKEKKLDVGQEEMLELSLDRWERRLADRQEYKYDDEPEPLVGLDLDKPQGSTLALPQDADDAPPRLLPTQPDSKQEKRKKKKKKNKKAKRQAASEAAQDGAHDFQGSEAVKPSKHQFFGDEE